MSIYRELKLESDITQFAFRGKRKHVVKVNVPNIGLPKQQIDIEIPTGSRDHVIVPNTPRITFDLELDSKDKTRSVVPNIGRAIVATKVLTLGSTDIQTILNADVVDTFRDLYLSKTDRRYRLLQGINSPQGLKARVGATKAYGTPLTFTAEENAIKKTLVNKFPIPLDFDFFNQPVYPYGLNEKLFVRIKLNSAENVVLATGDANATFKISDICLEYDAIIDNGYAEQMMTSYSGYASIPFRKVVCNHYERLSKKDCMEIGYQRYISQESTGCLDAICRRI